MGTTENNKEAAYSNCLMKQNHFCTPEKSKQSTGYGAVLWHGVPQGRCPKREYFSIITVKPASTNDGTYQRAFSDALSRWAVSSWERWSLQYLDSKPYKALKLSTSTLNCAQNKLAVNTDDITDM